jgi:serpin B
MTESRQLVSRRALLLGLAGAVVATQVAGCGTDQATEDAPPLLTANVAREVPPGNAPVDAVAAGMTALGHALCRVSAPKTGNWIVSPLSIATAFAMARVGAGGTTASQLDHVFGFPRVGRDAAFNAITRALKTSNVPSRKTSRSADSPPAAPVVSLGNALFVQKGQPIGADFLRTLAAQYGSGARAVDFASPQAAAQINAWVRQQTADRIQKLFDSLDRTTTLVLANAVYLRADWAQRFDREESAPDRFTRADGSTTTVTMMTAGGRFRYASGAGWTAVELPYARSDLAMWIVLPQRGGAPTDILSPQVLKTVGTALTPVDRGLELFVPRWDFATDLNLTTELPKLGLTAPFGNADFSGIAPGLAISQAVHRANITVGEWGTEAAAATGTAMALSGRLPPELVFRADRPFAFAIVGGPHHVPLFMGTVDEPTAA